MQSGVKRGELRFRLTLRVDGCFYRLDWPYKKSPPILVSVLGALILETPE